MKAVIDYFHQNYYPDLSRDEVEKAITTTPDVAISKIHEDLYSDLPIEEVKAKIQPIPVDDLNHPGLKAYNDSLDLYNQGLAHAKLFHPELGENPENKPFIKGEVYDHFPFNNSKDWTKSSYDQREKFIKDTQNFINILKNKREDDTDVWQGMGLGNKEETIKAYETALYGKPEHEKFLEKSLSTQIYPTGMYNDHDPAFTKPTKVYEYQPKKKVIIPYKQ